MMLEMLFLLLRTENSVLVRLAEVHIGLADSGYVMRTIHAGVHALAGAAALIVCSWRQSQSLPECAHSE